MSERKLEETELPPPDEKESPVNSGSLNHGFFPGEVCKKGELAVIEVVLADGAVWKLKP